MNLQLVPHIKANILKAHSSLKGSSSGAAVAILLVEREELNVLLIKKCSREGYDWSGHMAFPGGRVDGEDKNLQETALREMHEEVGIEAQAVEKIASLGVFRTHIKNLTVEAFVFLWRGTDEIVIHENEVEWTVEVPLGHFLDHHIKERFHEKSPDELGLDLRYPIENHTVWGLTANMLHTLLEALRGTLLDS